jgi:tetratricopeptide (TPR) repeat protein
MTFSKERWQRLNDLFHAAADLPPERRQAFLNIEASGDEELRAQLEGMLAQEAEANSRLSEVIGSVAAAATGANAWTERRFGPYRIVREIGRGGMGIVFEAARDDQEYRKRVALKIAPGWHNPEPAGQRFRRERQILAELEHPNIARFLDGGAEEGLPYFAMELVEGAPITEYCRKHTLSIRERVGLFLQVCSAVHYAHQRLVIHRDIKPSNILVSPEGVPKLLDFGIAKILEDQGGDTQTTIGRMMWTPDYASPEQVRGSSITTRTDVYALGLLLFEMLTGERGQLADSSSPLALDRSICETEIPAASRTAARLGDRIVAKLLEGDLDTILAKALQKDSGQRYGSVGELMDDIRRYLNGEVVQARPATLAYRTGKFVRRNRLPVIAGVVVAFTIAVGVTATLRQARRAERRFGEVRKLANTFLFDFHDRIQNLPGSTEARSFVVKTAINYLDSLSRDASGDNALLLELASAYHKVGVAQGDYLNPNLGQPKDAIASFDKAIHLAEQVLRTDPRNRTALRTLVESHTRKGDNLGNMLGSNAGTASLLKAMEYSRRLIAAGGAETADIKADARLHLTYGDNLVDLDPKASIAEYQKAIDTAEAAYLRTHDEMWRGIYPGTYHRMSRALEGLGDTPQAIALLEKGVAITERRLETDPQNTTNQMMMLALLSRLAGYLGDPQAFCVNAPGRALVYLQRVDKIVRQMIAADPRDVQALRLKVINDDKLSMLYTSLDPAESLRFATESVVGANRLIEMSPDNRTSLHLRAATLDQLANSYLIARQPNRSIATFKDALRAREAALRLDPSDLGTQEGLLWTQLGYGRALTSVGRGTEAESMLQVASEHADRLAKPRPDDLYFLKDQADVAEAIGDYNASRGDRSGALNRYQQSQQLWEKWAKIAAPNPFPKWNADRVRGKAAIVSADAGPAARHN